MTESVLDSFSPAARSWFAGAFDAPTEAQRLAWSSIGAGDDTLVVAPTGSGKTLAAFFWALDRLSAEEPPRDPAERCRVLYVSPLKALAVDIERNLRAPLSGLRQAAHRLGLAEPEVTVGIRTGDTPAEERRRFAKRPPDILITTPESLFLMLTSQAREGLRGVETVIVDEVHALAGTKRGAHLALSLERLDELCTAPRTSESGGTGAVRPSTGPGHGDRAGDGTPRPRPQRVGLSATVRPVEEVAAYLGGTRPASVVQPAYDKQWDLRIVVPVEDMAELGGPGGGDNGPLGAPEQRSIWPHVEERVLDLIEAHRSTIIFANSRRLAERLCGRLNELAYERAHGEALPEDGSPADLMGGSGATRGAGAEVVRAHHGSVSKEERAAIEDALKTGRLPAVVATSSLELGIDMGAVDLVVQVESPPSVASGLQRVGRAGHQVGAVSQGVLFPKYRGDLVQTTVVAERMRSGGIEELRYPRNPLDVLAQQVVAMTAMDEWHLDDLAALVHRAAPFATLPRSALEATLDMLAGRYPSDEFAELRPRLVWDRATGTLNARPGAQRLAVTSGGTIPDRGLFGVFIVGEKASRVGELDEEMVYESRVGDVFVLGASSWRIEDITPDRVLVSPAPGLPGRLPFWHGDAPGRPAELGRALGAFTRELAEQKPAVAQARVRAAGLDAYAAENLVSYLKEQREATGYVPDDRTLVVERFRDELGDWRVVVHSPFGGQVHAPWSLAIAARLRERYGVDVQTMHADDGIVLRIPDMEQPPDADVAIFDPDEIEGLVTSELGGSALFAARFRECAARALLLPRRRPGHRMPLWQQRQRAAQLLSVASQYGSFPVVLETMRECLQDVFDVPGLVELMRDLAGRKVRMVEVETPEASPFARSLLFRYIGAFMYEGDSPLAERRAQALALDSSLLAELLGQAELRELLDPEVVEEVGRELQRLTEDRRVRDMEGVADLLRDLGPLSLAEVTERTILASATEASGASEAETTPDDAVEGDAVEGGAVEGGAVEGDAVDGGAVEGGAVEDGASADGGGAGGAAAEGAVAVWLEELGATRRAIRVRIAGEDRWAAIEDAGRLRDALGTPLPVGVPEAFTEPVADPLGDLVSRYARTHGPFTTGEVAARFGLGVAVVHEALRRLGASGRVAEGEFRPGGRGTEWCDAEVLRRLRRRSLARLRKEVEPSPPEALAKLLPAWHQIGGGRLRGIDALIQAVEQLQGYPIPASALETLVLPARVPDYTPALLDELTSAGEVVWTGAGGLPGGDGWITLTMADSAATLLPEPVEITRTPVHDAILEALSDGGAVFFRTLSDRVNSGHTAADAGPDDSRAGRVSDTDLAAAVWDLVWAGLLTNDTLAPLRSALGSGRTRATHRSRSRRRPAMPTRSGPPTVSGRWWLVPEREADPTRRAYVLAETTLDRYGVVTRGSVMAERAAGGFAAVYPVLRGFEETGRCRRGYFVEGLGAAQFALPGAVDRMRTLAAPTASAPAMVLAATDPANAYGAALSWPERPGEAASGHKPGRKAGALVVLVDGRLVLYVERGGKTLLSWTDEPEVLQPAVDALALAVREGALGRLTVERADGGGVYDSPLAAALEAAGFHPTPRGLRLRR